MHQEGTGSLTPWPVRLNNIRDSSTLILPPPPTPLLCYWDFKVLRPSGNVQLPALTGRGSDSNDATSMFASLQCVKNT